MEKLRSDENEIRKRVVRSLVVSLAGEKDLWSKLVNPETKTLDLERISNISLLRFYLALKGDEKNPRLTFFGGKIGDNENLTEAIQREIGEELGTFSLGSGRQTVLGKWVYEVNKDGRQLSRRVVLTYNPVELVADRLIGDKKIREIKIVDLEQLKSLVENGELNEIPLEGHLSFKDELDQIEIEEEEKAKRNKALEKGLSWMEHIEDYLRKKLRDFVEEKGENISYEEFSSFYQKLLAKFKRKGLEVSTKKEEGKDIEEDQSLSESEKKQRRELLNALNSGFLGRDILYFLPNLAEHGVDWLGLENATEGTKIFVGFLKELYEEFITSHSEFFNQNRELENNLLVEANFFRSFGLYIEGKLRKIFGLNEDQFFEAFSLADNFLKELLESFKLADHNLIHGFYQEYALVNEVTNAGLGKLLFLVMNLEYDNRSYTRIRFEALRSLLILLKTLAGYKRYKELQRSLKDNKIGLAIERFFGKIAGEAIIEFPTGSRFNIFIRRSNNEEFIVDQKPVKSFSSFLRKSFLEGPYKINDLASVNIVLSSDDNGDDREFRRSQVEKMEDIYHRFLDYIKESYQERYSVEVLEEKDYGTKDYINLGYVQQDNITGKRSGSQGNRLVRKKVVIKLTNKNNDQDTEIMELVFYPFRSITNRSGFWGWQQKIADDTEYMIRRILASERGIPSIYDLLYPPQLYPGHYFHRLYSLYHSD